MQKEQTRSHDYILKACVLYFLHFTKQYHFKNYEKWFLINLKSSFYLQDIQFFVVFFLSLSQFPDSGETGIIITLRIGLHKLANKIFGITQESLCIKSSKLARF